MKKLDEISSALARRYISKASQDDAERRYGSVDAKGDRLGGRSSVLRQAVKDGEPGAEQELATHRRKLKNRRQGIERAIDRVSEETNHLNELSAVVLAKYLIKANQSAKHAKRRHDISAAFNKWIQQKEEREALAELSSKSTLSYFNKACASRAEAEKSGDVNKVKRRERGAFRAIDYLAKKEGLRSKPKRSLMKVKRYAAGKTFEE